MFTILLLNSKIVLQLDRADNLELGKMMDLTKMPLLCRESDDTSSMINDLLMQVDEEEELEASDTEQTDEAPQNPSNESSRTETKPDTPGLLTEKLIYKIKTKEELWLESEEHHKLMHNCEICDQNFKEHADLIDHIKCHASKPKTVNITTSTPIIKIRYRCHHCTFMTYEKKLIAYHLAHNHLKINTCNFCYGIFDDADDTKIVNHKFLCRLKTLKYKCRRCHYRFRTQEKLELHTQNCADHFCYICDLTFDTFIDLLQHRQIRHRSKTLHQCSKCSVRLQSKPALAKHMLRCHDEIAEIFRCDTCGRTDFKTKNLLIRHKWLSHNPASKMYHCKLCSQSFSRQGRLKKHLIVHEEDEEKARPFKCEICDKRYFRKSVLKNHILKVHERIMKAMCNVCGRQFKALHNLKVHMFSHTGEKPFLCHVCGKGFYTTGNLRVHELDIHNIMPWKCEVCGEGFKLKAPYNKHMFEEHRIRL